MTPREVLELIFPGPVSRRGGGGAAAAMAAQPHYRELFPAPRQRWVDALSLTRRALARDRRAGPARSTAARTGSCRSSTALALLRALPDARMHVFGGCGHATPLERTDEFNDLVRSFLQMTEFAVLRAPSQVLFGVGMAAAAGRVAAGHGRRVLVCTDPIIAETPGFATVRESLEG